MEYLIDAYLQLKKQNHLDLDVMLTVQSLTTAKEDSLKKFLNYVTDELKVDGITISPGFAYERAPDQQHFIKRSNTKNFLEMFLNLKNLKNGISVILVYILIS